MKDEEMAEEYCNHLQSEMLAYTPENPRQQRTVTLLDVEEAFLAGLKAGRLQWHKITDKLPEIDVLVYLWNKIDDYPVVACRHIPYGQEEWVWDCKWGSGFTISQSKGKDYLWKEIVLPKEIEK